MSDIHSSETAPKSRDKFWGRIMTGVCAVVGAALIADALIDFVPGIENPGDGLEMSAGAVALGAAVGFILLTPKNKE